MQQSEILEADRIEDARRFIKDNKTQLQELKRIIDEERLADVNTIHELKAKKKAIKMVNDWISAIWGITTADLPEPLREYNIFNIIEDVK